MRKCTRNLEKKQKGTYLWVHTLVVYKFSINKEGFKLEAAAVKKRTHMQSHMLNEAPHGIIRGAQETAAESDVSSSKESAQRHTTNHHYSPLCYQNLSTYV